jgi:hypothetical protein
MFCKNLKLDFPVDQPQLITKGEFLNHLNFSVYCILCSLAVIQQFFVIFSYETDENISMPACELLVFFS